jgi:hypothetical protein
MPSRKAVVSTMNHVPYKTVALFEEKQKSPSPLQKSPEAFAAMI